MDSARVPFSFPEVYQGLASGGGIVTATTAGLILEYQVKDGFFGVIKSRVHMGQLELRVARADKRAAQSLVSVLTLTLSERQLAELDAKRR